MYLAYCLISARNLGNELFFVFIAFYGFLKFSFFTILTLNFIVCCILNTSNYG